MGAETQFVNRWLREKHPNPPLWIRPRLGKAAFPEQARLLSVTLRFPDAIFIESGIVHIVEAKLKLLSQAIGQLLLYQKLFRDTLEFEPWWDSPMKMILLTTRVDQAVKELAEAQGIIYETFD